MDSFDLLQKLDAQHGKKSDYKTTVNMEDINKITAERISRNQLKEDAGLSDAMTTPDKESISPKETTEKTTRNLTPTLEVVDIVTEEPDKGKDEKDEDAR